MKIELTTRQILHMIQEGYNHGVKETAEGKVTQDNKHTLKSFSEIASQNILMRHMWENDFHQT